MLDHRNMTAEDAQARMGAQVSRDERLAAADVVLDNSGSLADVTEQVDRLWFERLVPFARNVAARAAAERSGGPVLYPPNPGWPRQAARLIARIQAALADSRGPEEASMFLGLDHVGSTSVPGLEAKNVLDLQLTVPDLAAAKALVPALAAAGYPEVPGITSDAPKASRPDPADWVKRFHANADPGRAVNLHVRAAGSAGWWFAYCFRDWLRADPDAAGDYLAFKRRLAELHAGDAGTAAYAADKEPWFAAADARMERWAKNTGWAPPSYPS